MTPDRLQDRLRDFVPANDPVRVLMEQAADRIDELEAGPASTLPDAYQPPMARCDNPDGRCTMREWCTSHDSCWADPHRDRSAGADGSEDSWEFTDDELPLIPMRRYFAATPEGRAAYQAKMVTWVRLVMQTTNPEQPTDAR